MKFDSQLRPASETSWVVLCGGKTTAPVLLADYVTTGNGLKMASTVAYNL